MRRHRIFLAAIALLAAIVPASLWAQDSSAADARGEYGVSLAMSGEEARAESLFITMLSHTRGDARALNNLGNIRLLKGETGVALAFYERSLRGDSLDAGIHLNRGTALMLIGEKSRSEESFAIGIKLAGGLEQAHALLGLSTTREPGAGRAAKKNMINPDQVRAMLRNAATSVPQRSAPATTATNEGSAATKNTSAWRSAGPRGADGSQSSHLLYWKR